MLFPENFGLDDKAAEAMIERAKQHTQNLELRS